MLSTDSVQISINVVDMNSGAVVSQVTKNVNSLGEAGVRTGAQVRQGMGEIGVGARAATEKIRLPLEELGIRLPRAFVGLIAQSHAAQTAIGAVGGALVGIGAIQIGALIFTQLIDGAEKLWHNVLDVNGAVKDYEEEADKAKQKDFTNTHSIETTILRIHEATDALRQYQAEAARHAEARFDPTKQDWIGRGLGMAGTVGASLEAVRESAWAHDANANAMDAQRQLDELRRERLPEQQHQEIVGRIEVQRSIDEQLQGEAKINALHKDRLDLIREEARFNSEQEGAFGNPVATGGALSTTPIGAGGVKGFIGGFKPASTDEQKADADTATERYNLRREQAEELRRIHEEAVESALHGSAVYHAQEAHAIDDLQRKGLASAQAVNDIREKFHNEEMNRLQAQILETEKIERDAAASGLGPIAKIQVEGANRVAGIRDDSFEDVDSQGHSALADRQRAAAQSETHTQILQSEKDFAQSVDELTDQWVDHEVGGFARIRAEAQKAIDEKTAAFNKGTAGLDQNSPEFQQYQGNLDRAKGIINQGAGEQSQDLMRRNEQETSQIEAEARSKLLSSEKNQTAAIESEYEERLRKFQDWKTQELASGQLSAQEQADINDQFNRRIIAADELRDAQLEDAARQAHEKMAGEFTSLFKSLDHPAEALKELGDKAAGQAAAAMVQRMQERFGGGAGAGAPMSEHLGMPAIFDRIAGTPHAAAAPSPAAPGAPIEPGAPQPPFALSHASEPSKMISLASAEIRIASANVTISGYGGASSTDEASSAGHSTIPGGSTQLLSLGGYSEMGSTAGAGDVGSAVAGAPAGAQSARVGPSTMPGIAEPVLHVRGYSGHPGAASAITAAPEAGAVSSSTAAATSFGSSTPSAVEPSFSVGTAMAGFAPVAPIGISGAPGATAPGTPIETGGAGDTGWAGTAPAGAASGATGPLVNSTAAKANGVMNDVGQGISLGKKALSIFGGGGSGAGGSDDGSASAGTGVAGGGSSATDQIPLQSMKNFNVNQMATSSSTGGMLNGGGFMSNIGGAATGAMGLFGAVEGNGGVGGALSGAMSGMQLGMSLGGPLGAAIGAAGGAVIGAIGFGGKEKARVYYLKTVLPRITADTDGFEQGTMDYTSAYSDLEALNSEADKTLTKMGPEGRHYYESDVIGKIHEAEGKLTAEQRAGRSEYTPAAAQYSAGTDFVPSTGQYRLHRGESVLTAEETEQRGSAPSGGGAAPTRMAAQTQSTWGGDIHLHVHAMDTKGVRQFMDNNKHYIRAALNKSFAENSGGSDAGY